MNWLIARDTALLHSLNGKAGQHALLDALMIGCAKYTPAVFALVLMGLWLTWRARNQRSALLAGGSALLALGIGQLVGMAFPRLRPYERADLGPVRLLVPHSPDTSFPSDHATLAFAVTVMLWKLDRRLGLASLLVSLWLCVARVFIGAHYPSDVLGGALLGAAVGAGVLWASQRKPLAPVLEQTFAWLRRFHVAAASQDPESAGAGAAAADVSIPARDAKKSGAVAELWLGVMRRIPDVARRGRRG